MFKHLLFGIFLCCTTLCFGQIHRVDSLLEAFLNDKQPDKSNLFELINHELGGIPSEKAIEILDDKLTQVNPMSLNAIELHRFKGFVYNSKGNVSEALQLARHYLEIARQLDDQMAIGHCNLDIGHYYRTLGFYSYSAEYLSDASKIFSKLNAPRETGQGYYSAALTSYQAGNPVQSLEEQKLSVHYLMQLPASERTNNDLFYLMSGYNTMGLSYKRLKVYDSALLYFDRGDSIARDLNNVFWMKLLGGNKGEVYFLMGNIDKAFPLFKADYEEMIKQSEITLIYSS